MSWDSVIFNVMESIDREKYVLALYYMEAKSEDILTKVESIALEQSTGTWVDVPEETQDIRQRHVARVLAVHEVPDYEDALPEDTSCRKFIFLLGFPVINLHGQLPQLLTAVYGNISMAGKLKLLDIYFPQSFVRKYKGPKFGIEGIRKILKIYDRPVLLAMFKPCVGMEPKTLGKVLFELGTAGLDIIKDDELLADPDFCPVEERLEICMKMIEKVYKETGRRMLYAINITDNFDKMFTKARKAIAAGANCLMVNTYTVSYAAMSALAEDNKINVPILCHPDFAGAMFSSPYYGLTSSLVLGKLPRLAGADMVIYPSHFGKVPMVRERVIRIAQELAAPLYHLKSVFPGPSAGMHPGLVEQLIKEFGNDLLIGAGGGINAHPQGPKAGVKAFLQAIEAVQKNIPLKTMAKKHKELATAIQKWGVFEEGKANYSLIK